MINRAALLIVDGTHRSADGQWQAPPGRFVIVNAMELAAGTFTVKASFTVFFLVPDNHRLLAFPRELKQGDSETISIS